MAKTKFDYDLIVIGSGAAGSVATEIAARKGLTTAVVEQGDLGGSAPHATDIPSQALLTAAHNLDAARRGTSFGLRTTTIGYNYPSIKKWKDLAVRRSGAASTSEYFRSRGITIFRGRAHFLSNNEISIGRRHLTAEKFLIATGSTFPTPNIAGLENIDILTPETAIDLLRPPKSLFIVGAGATGCEFAELFAIFGTKVILADAKKRILPRADDEVSNLVKDLFQKARGMEILTASRVIGVKKDSSGVAVTYLNGATERTVKVEKVLLATGYAPNTDLGLENAGVEYGFEGVKIDDYARTSARNIWAAGGVVGNFAYTHSAIYEARVAAGNLTSRNKTPLDYRAMPHAVWLSPEIATVGANETDLVRDNVKFQRSIVQNSVVTRANTSNFAVGFTKILVDKDGKLLGATIIAPNAAEIIGELTLAIQSGLTAAQVANTIHPFGSWNEAVRLACAKI